MMQPTLRLMSLLLFFTLIVSTSAYSQSDWEIAPQQSRQPETSEEEPVNSPTKEDVVYLSNGDILKGQVINHDINITTPYGALAVPLRKCASVIFAGSGPNTQVIQTINNNRLTGIITDRIIQFRTGESDVKLDLRKEHLRTLILRDSQSRNRQTSDGDKTNLFVMTNGDLLTGKADLTMLMVRTAYGDLSAKMSEVKKIELDRSMDSRVVVNLKNGDVMRGNLVNDELNLELDLGIKIPAVYKGQIAQVFFDDGASQAAALIGGENIVTEVIQQTTQVTGEDFTNSLGMRLKFIPAGSFKMGSLKGDPDEQPIHDVTLSKPFYISTHEVTQEQFEKIMEFNPSVFLGPSRPVDSVSWNEAVDFCKKLSQKEMVSYRLPTEAEWEYCCRAGSQTEYFSGEDFDPAYCWYQDNSGMQTHDVGTLKPNPWGLYDMTGNLWEWCHDFYEHSYENWQPMRPGSSPPPSEESGRGHVLRGGAWNMPPIYVRPADRHGAGPDEHGNDFGFRVVREIR